MRIPVFVLLPCILAVTAVSAHPLEKREPGLWEIKTSKGAPLVALMEGMQETLKKMPPAQRKQMEQMMQSTGASLSEPTIIRQCLTPEIIAREFQPYSDDPEMQCSSTVQEVSVSESRFTFSCSKGKAQWKGNGRIWDAAPKSYKSDMTMQGTVEGRPVKLDMTHEARWLGADCKGLKPQR